MAKSGAGDLKMATNNSYNGGTTVSTGKLTVGNQNGLGSGLVSLAAGTTFQQVDFEGNSLTGALPNAFELTGTGNVTMQISFGEKDIWLSQPVTGTGGMTVQGGVRSLTLTANNSFEGGLILKNDTNRIVIASLTALGTGTFRTERTTAGSGRLETMANVSASPGVANPIDIASGAYLNVTADGSNHLWLSGPITSAVGTGSLYKDGSATLTLSGTNTYSGTTAVTAGKLLVNGTNSGTGAVSVSSNATLGGTGSIGGNVTYASGALAKFTEGSPLTIAGTLTLNDNVVHLALPTNLGNGTYTLATYTDLGSTGTFNVTPVIDSGSLAAGGTATVATVMALSSLTVVGACGSDYDTWLGGYTFADGANTTPTGDPDGDGLTNQQEYAFGLNPTLGSSVNPITVPLDQTTGMFTYTRRATPEAAGLTYTVLTSTDLDTWLPDVDATAGQNLIGTADGVETVEVTLSGIKPLAATKLFVRVEAAPTP